MRNIFIISLLAVFSSFPFILSAQDLDPTVEVTRAYEGKLMEIHKPAFEMNVPDSVMHFALDFDYSVFENPYRGSYEFNPYLLSMRPSSADTGERKLFLRAGVGYQLHPELDFVWSPMFRNRSFNMDVYAIHRSFIGNYWNIMPVEDTPGIAVLDRTADRSTWNGYDLLTRAGADLRYDASGVAVDFGTGYYGLAVKDRVWNRGFNAIDVRLGITTKPADVEKAVYDIKAGYRFGQDRLNGAAGLSEHLFDFEMSFGPLTRGKHRLSFDLGTEMASYSRAFTAMTGEVFAAPHYVLGRNRLHLDLGIRLAKLLWSKETDDRYMSKEQYVYPDITFSYVLLPKSLKFYIAAEGGNTLNTYSSIIERNHHLTYATVPTFLGSTMERIRAYAGFDGRIASRFSYNIKGGYVNYGRAPVDAVLVDNVPYAVFRYVQYQKWFVSFDWLFKTESVRVDGEVSYDHAWGDAFESGYAGVAVLRPAAFTGDVSFEYNWNRRVFCGADCSFSTARTGEVKVPGYADLGIFAEYATAKRLSFWIRGGNLLNMTIQRTPLYAERGVNFTAGICLSL